jgi:DNA-directed RNA polymerase specialized sigma24 family protein
MTGDPPPRPAERFDEVFDVYFAEIHRYAAKRLGPDAAADVAAQTFLEAFRQRRRYDPERAGVRTWLYGIATKVVGRHQRAETRALRARARLGPGRNAEEHTERVDSRVSAEGLRGELAGAIAALPTRWAAEASHWPPPTAPRRSPASSACQRPSGGPTTPAQ